MDKHEIKKVVNRIKASSKYYGVKCYKTMPKGHQRHREGSRQREVRIPLLPPATWLHRNEYKAERKILLKNLSGNSSWKNGAPEKEVAACE